MDGSQHPKAKAGVTGVFNLVPAGVLQRRRRYVAGRFPLGHPNFSSEGYLLGPDPQSTPSAAKQRESGPAASQPPPALVLSNKQQQPGSGPGKQLQGLPRADAGSNYFVLMKAGRDFCVYPLDTSYTFKPIIRSAVQSVDELEAAEKQAASAAGGGAAGGGGAGRIFMPKSVRQAMQREAAAEAADRDLKEEALPILQDKVAELAVKYGSAPTDRQKLLLDAVSEDDSSDDMGALEQDDDEWGGADRRARGRARGKKGQAEGQAAGDKAGKGGGDEGGNPEDELAEDIYAGEEDELRPMRPTEDVDWEFAEEAADDDLEQGASDEEGLDDDPGYRKELGLEGDDDDEDEKAKQEKLAREAEAAEQAAAAKEAAGAADGAAADADEDMLDIDESEFDADDLDKLAEERERNGAASPAVKKRKRSVTPPGAAVVAAMARSATPVARRAATPPTAAVSAVAAAGRAATPPLGAAAKAASSRKTPPPGTRRGTPPPAGVVPKRKRDEVAAPAAAPAAAAGAGAPAVLTTAAAVPGGLAPWEWTADQLDAAGVPTTDGIIQALTHMGPVPTEQLQLLQDRLNLAQIGNDGKTLLKRRLLQVAKVGVIDGRKYMVLK